ncbi:hypothetical protein [Vagococcus fluvialis]|uniref:hypothetical protein n=1 Tax=Vagococcus fluvialis TaxID=2738 RepID=UPI001D0A2157|nr:hypothetical protein [Vagococcus fluvialis]UDM70168.1 hypothetical protein K5L00_08445 [Vagococcus fluvialis]UDM77587.1 hypothetical protein K5K98_03990 [Vagococcus fluvialis]UDM81857.1 hypothetical protein K5K96_10925 [Vagococcus fluvialis]
MSPTEDYFFSNNISIWSHRRTNSLTWFNTEDGMFIQNVLGHLYKEDDGKCERVV